MITQYRFTVKEKEGSGRPLPSFWSYRFYSWLLTQISDEYASSLHDQGEKPISQYLYRDRVSDSDVWVVNLLSTEASEIFGAPLEKVSEIPLHTGTIQVELNSKDTWTAMQLASYAREKEVSRRRTIRFATPTAFKSEGRYAIFPQEKWLIQTLILKWNQTFPEMPLDDEDAVAALERGIKIADYTLRSTRYPLKNIKIPSFIGNVTMESHLALPMEEIWQLLLCFATFSGVGIKTTLGMGAVQADSLLY